MKVLVLLTTVAASAIALAGCETPQQQNAAGGALLGGATGAIIGSAVSHGSPGGALVGGALGAATGAMVGSAATPPGPPPGYYGPGPYADGPPPGYAGGPPPGYAGGPPPGYAGGPPPRCAHWGFDYYGNRICTAYYRAEGFGRLSSAESGRKFSLTPTSSAEGRNDTPRPDSPFAAEFLASPNHGERRGYSKPDCVILHYTGMPTGEAAMALLRDPASELSAHYFVWEDGRIVQLVAEARRAWHAGVGVWKGECDINSCSIGIEIVNPGHDGGSPPFPEAQIEAVIALTRDICDRHAIKPERVLAHSDIAPARKIDPGERFPWDRLWREGVGHWVKPASIVQGPVLKRSAEGPAVRALQAMLALYGYGAELTGVYDKRTELYVRAFQRHFRAAKVDGEADVSTAETLRRLIEALRT